MRLFLSVPVFCSLILFGANPHHKKLSYSGSLNNTLIYSDTTIIDSGKKIDIISRKTPDSNNAKTESISALGDCTSWLYLPSKESYVRVGDLDIPGNQV